MNHHQKAERVFTVLLLVLLGAAMIHAQVFDLEAIRGSTLPDQTWNEDTNHTFLISTYFSDTQLDPLNYTFRFNPSGDNVTGVLKTGWSKVLALPGTIRDVVTDDTYMYVVHGTNVTSYATSSSLYINTTTEGALRGACVFQSGIAAVGDYGEVWYRNSSGIYNITNSTTLDNPISSCVAYGDVLYLFDNETVYLRNSSVNQSYHYSVISGAPTCYNHHASTTATGVMYFSCGFDLFSYSGSFSNVTQFKTNITSLYGSGSDVYIGLQNGTVYKRSGSTLIPLGTARGPVYGLTLVGTTVYVGTNATLEYYNGSLIRPVESQSTLSTGPLYPVTVNNKVYIGSGSGEVDIFNGTHSTSILLIPGPHYNSLQTSGVTLLINATDGGTDSKYVSVDLFVNAVNDAPVFNGTHIQEIDMQEDTNYSFDIASYFTDVEEFEQNLNYSLKTSPVHFTYVYDNNTGNITFIPEANFASDESFTVVARDSDGATGETNSFTIDVANIPDDIINLQNISNFSWSEDTVLKVNLSDYYYDPDGMLVAYDYHDLANTSFSISLARSSGKLNITPPPNFVGNTTVNFTIVDYFGSVNYSELVYLFVTDIPDGVRYNSSKPIADMRWLEDSVNTSLNLSQHFYDFTSNITGYTVIDNRLTGLCHFESSACTKGLSVVNDSASVYTSGVFSNGLFVTNTTFLAYNFTGRTQTTAGTIEVYVRDVAGTSDTATVTYFDTRNETGRNGLVVYRNASQIMARYVGTVDNATDTIAYTFTNQTFGINTSHHLALRYQSVSGGTDMGLILDGVLVANQSRAPVFTSVGTRLVIGANATAGQQPNALFDELRIYNVTKPVAEIDNDYQFASPLLSFDIDNTTGIVTMTPQANWSGSTYYSFCAIDENASTADSGLVNFSLVNVNDNPFQKKSLNTLTIYEDTPAVHIIDLDDYFDDWDNKTLVYGVAGGASLTATLDAFNRVNLTTAVDFYGASTLSINVSDGSYTLNTTVDVTVVSQSDTVGLVPITPYARQNGTIPLYFFTSSVDEGAVNVTVRYSLDGGLTWSNATGPQLANLSSSNSTNRIHASKDAFIRSDQSTRNYGSNISLEVGTDGSTRARALLQFVIPPADIGMIRKATLNLFQRAAVGEDRRFGVYGVNSSWNENNVTWNTAPTNTSLYGSALVTGSEEYKIFNITSLVKIWANQSTNNGVFVRDMNEPATVGLHTFGSREYTGNSTPYVEITYNGSEHVFLWDSISDLNYTNQNLVVVNITVHGSQESSITQNFTVYNNNPPVRVEGANTTVEFIEDGTYTLNVSPYFSDNDTGQVLTYTLWNHQNITVIDDVDLKGTTQAINTAAGFQGSPEAIYDNDEILVTYVDFSDGDADIVVERHDGALNRVRTTRVTSDDTTQVQPVIVRGGTDTYVAWKDTTEDEGNIQLARLNASDEVVLRVNVTTTSGEERSPDIVFVNSSVYIIWQDTRNGVYQLYYSRIDVNGSVLTSATPVTDVSENVTMHDVVADSSGRIYMLWSANEQQVRYRVLNTSNLLESTQNISSVSTYAAQPSGVVDIAERVHVTYVVNRSDDNATDVFYAQLNSSILQSTARLTNDTDIRTTPIVGIDRYNRTYIVYQKGAGSAADIYLTRFNTTGTTLYTRNITTESGLQTSPALAVKQTGEKAIFWQHEGTDDDVKGVIIEVAESRFLLQGQTDFSGERVVVVQVHDGYATVNTTVLVNVTNTNDAPTYQGPQTFGMYEDDSNTSINLTSYFDDVDSVNLTYTANASDNLTVSVSGSLLNVSASTADFSGTAAFTVSASDGYNTTSATVTVTVRAVNDAPVLIANISEQLFEVSQNATLNISPYFRDVDNRTLVYGSTDPANISVIINASTGLVVLTSESGWYGTRSILFNATDGMNTTRSNNVTITIQLLSRVISSTIDGVLYNGNYSNISGLLNSTINVSTLYNTTANHSRIFNSTLRDTQVASANITSGVMWTGKIVMFNGTFIDGIPSPKNLTDLVNYYPTASLGVSATTGTTRTTFTFNASASTDPNINGDLNDNISYYWDFDDGTNITNVSATKVYSSAGTYTVRLNITDRFGRTTSVTQAIVVSTYSDPTPPPGGGSSSSSSSGSSSGFWVTPTCTESWVCTDWSPCFDGLMTRICTDQNECNTTKDKPLQEDICDDLFEDDPCFNGQLDDGEDDIDCGGLCPPCLDEEWEEETVPPEMEEVWDEEEDMFTEEPALISLYEEAMFYAMMLPRNAWYGIGAGVFMLLLLSIVGIALHTKHKHTTHHAVDELARYITQSRQQGYPDSVIVQVLKRAGHGAGLIEKAFEVSMHYSLVDYALQCLGAGYSAGQILKALVTSGWHKKKAKTVVKHAHRKHISQKKENKNKKTVKSKS